MSPLSTKWMNQLRLWSCVVSSLRKTESGVVGNALMWLHVMWKRSLVAMTQHSYQLTQQFPSVLSQVLTICDFPYVVSVQRVLYVFCMHFYGERVFTEVSLEVQCHWQLHVKAESRRSLQWACQWRVQKTLCSAWLTWSEITLCWKRVILLCTPS